MLVCSDGPEDVSHLKVDQSFLFSTRAFFPQLDTYMDEAFITSAFAAMGEAVVTVKMIKNRVTG